MENYEYMNLYHYFASLSQFYDKSNDKNTPISMYPTMVSDGEKFVSNNLLQNMMHDRMALETNYYMNYMAAVYWKYLADQNQYGNGLLQQRSKEPAADADKKFENYARDCWNSIYGQSRSSPPTADESDRCQGDLLKESLLEKNSDNQKSDLFKENYTFKASDKFEFSDCSDKALDNNDDNNNNSIKGPSKSVQITNNSSPSKRKKKRRYVSEPSTNRTPDKGNKFHFIDITPESIEELGKIENLIGDYTCKLCQETFENAFLLAQHKCQGIRDDLYVCDTCDKVFQSSANLASHKRWHTSAKTHKAFGNVRDLATTGNKSNPKVKNKGKIKMEVDTEVVTSTASVSFLQRTADEYCHYFDGRTDEISQELDISNPGSCETNIGTQSNVLRDESDDMTKFMANYDHRKSDVSPKDIDGKGEKIVFGGSKNIGRRKRTPKKNVIYKALKEVSSSDSDLVSNSNHPSRLDITKEMIRNLNDPDDYEFNELANDSVKFKNIKMDTELVDGEVNRSKQGQGEFNVSRIIRSPSQSEDEIVSSLLDLYESFKHT
ncbi:unnamed protein product [Gordionus sp. m RMFG-2023]